MLSSLKAIRSSVTQLAPSTKKPPVSQQGSLVKEALKAAASAMNGAHKVAQRVARVAGEVQKLAFNAVAVLQLPALGKRWVLLQSELHELSTDRVLVCKKACQGPTR